MGAGRYRRSVRAAVWAAALSGLPSTVAALRTGDDPLAATRAAGRLLCPRTTRTVPLLGAAAVAHAALSLGWTAVLARVLPRSMGAPRAVLLGASCGLAIGAADLGSARALGGPRLGPVAALPLGPQLADHVAFGVVAAVVLAQRDGVASRQDGR